MAEEKKDLSELVALIARLRTMADAKTKKTIRKIISLAYAYPYHNKQFTFDKDKTLSDNVNRLLIELTDSIEEDIDTYSDSAQGLSGNKEDSDKIIPFIHRDIAGEDLTQRLDKHMTRLRNLLEAYIAVGFANFMTESELYNSFLRNINNPFAWSPLKDAYSDPMYEAISVKEKGYGYGKSIDKDILKAIALVLSGAMIGSYNYAKQLLFERNGAIGWTTVRGSNYDCAVCDDMVGIVHPMSEIFSGWHPRCVCIMIPVYPE